MNKTCKILAADDNHANRLLIKRILEKIGVEVVTVSDGHEAVQKVAENTFDLVLMDLQMPVMDGFDAARLIRENNFQKPILALSANINDENVIKCKEMGMNDFHGKPFQRQQLISYVQKWLTR